MRKPHKKLDVWKLSMDHAVQVYRVTERFPQEERYGITGQIRRAGMSIPSNIAEGAARQTRKEFVNYLHMAQGSLSEMDTLLELARRLELLSLEDWNTLDGDMERMDKMLSGLIRHQKRHQATPGRLRS
jgi:four helix bundle protein